MFFSGNKTIDQCSGANLEINYPFHVMRIFSAACIACKNVELKPLKAFVCCRILLVKYFFSFCCAKSFSASISQSSNNFTCKKYYYSNRPRENLFSLTQKVNNMFCSLFNEWSILLRVLHYVNYALSNFFSTFFPS